MYELLLIRERKGLKLRHIVDSATIESEPASNQVISWSAPMPRYQEQLLRFHDLSPVTHVMPRGTIFNLRMVPLKCNDPMVTGYSACYLGCIMALHAHVKGEDTGFYKLSYAYRKHGVYIYMPLDPGEFISEIWLRPDRPHLAVAIAVGASHAIKVFGASSNPQVSSELIETG